MTQEVLFSRENHVGLITLNRPQALNALTFTMIKAIQTQLTAWRDDSEIHAVIVRGAGDRAFCAGGDVRAIYHHGRDGYDEKMDFFRAEYRLNRYIHEFNKPYIALMDGITMGGGVGISMHGSHPVASENFLFAMPETSIGFYPDVGASHLLARCPGHFGIYLGLTGKRLGAADAQALGLVRHIIPRNRFADVLIALINADLSSDAYQKIDVVLRQFLMPTPTISIEDYAGFVDSCFRHTDMKAIMMALNHSNDDWYKEVRHVLSEKSPLSLKVTLLQLQKATSMTLAECLDMDYCLTSHFMRDPNFDEGVRALLIDKDNQPHWQPKTLEAVNEIMVDSFFTGE